MIKAVLFDYGGVLTAGGRKDSISQTIAELFGIDIGWENLDDLHNQLRCGLISSEAFFKELARLHNSSKRLTEKDWHAVSEAVFVRSEKVYELAEKLRARGIKTGILSNVYQMSADEFRAVGNYDGFDPVILSSEVHLAKPDPAIFELAVNKLKLAPGEIILVDDQIKNIPPAENLGMKTVLATSPEQIVNETEAVIKKEAE